MKKIAIEHDKTHRGNASQFFIAGELCRRGLMAVVTMGNSPNTDILCSNKAGTRFAHVQVKTFLPGNRTCSVGLKAEKNYGSNFFWILGGIPGPDSKEIFSYYIIPASEMAMNIKESHQIWEKALGKKGQVRNKSDFRAIRMPPSKCLNGWDIQQYLNRWDLITAVLVD